MTKPFTWSYSALQSYETCPWRHYLTKISKEVVEPATPALSEGRDAHKVLELHLKGEQWLPPQYQQWLPIAEKVKAIPGTLKVEQKFALTATYKETSYFAKDVWLRGVFDVQIIQEKRAITLDWKTGKRKDDPWQLRLFAAATFELLPFIDEVHTGYVWLYPRKLDKEVIQRTEGAGIWKEFAVRVHRIELSLRNSNWPKRPSGLCRKHCPVGRDRCEHCG